MRVESQDAQGATVSFQCRTEKETLEDASLANKEKSPPTSMVLRFSYRSDAAELTPLFSGTAWSTMIWRDAVDQMCDWMTREGREEIAGKHVIELGCSVGVPGLCAALECGAASARLTDKDAKELAVLRSSLAESREFQEIQLAQKVLVQELDWSDETQLESVRADVVLAVECVSVDVYGWESLEALARTIKRVGRGKGTLVMLSSRRREKDGLDEFMELFAGICESRKPEVLSQAGNGCVLIRGVL